MKALRISRKPVGDLGVCTPGESGDSMAAQQSERRDRSVNPRSVAGLYLA